MNLLLLRRHWIWKLRILSWSVLLRILRLLDVLSSLLQPLLHRIDWSLVGNYPFDFTLGGGWDLIELLVRSGVALLRHPAFDLLLSSVRPCVLKPDQVSVRPGLGSWDIVGPEVVGRAVLTVDLVLDVEGGRVVVDHRPVARSF